MPCLLIMAAVLDASHTSCLLVLQVWLQYQSLWDMEVGYVFGRLESDLTRWQRVLMDIK